MAIFLPGIEAFSKISAQWAVAIVIFIIFLFNWGYFTLFEAFWNGRTPGKRVARIRVIQRSGRAIGLFESMARNLVRYVDQFPFFYAVGVITIFVTRQHQRLGDLAAGTLVVRDRAQESAAVGRVGSAHLHRADLCRQRPCPGAAPRLLAAGHRHCEALVHRPGGAGGILRAPAGHDPAHAPCLAERIAAAIQAKSGLEPPAGASVETFLEATARQLRDQARMQ